MNVFESIGGLALCRLRFLKLEYDARYVREMKHSLAHRKNHTPTSCDTASGMDRDTFSLLAERGYSGRNPEMDEGVPSAIR